MKAIRLALGSFLFVAFFGHVSQAQVQRTFVSGLGNDGNPCSRTAPCRTFTHAIMETSAGGEVYVLDSAGYGTFTIAQSVTINAPQGVTAGISVFSGDGIDINAGATDTVILRGLTINNQGSSGNGIFCTQVGTLHVETCIVSGFVIANGIQVAGPANIFVANTIARGNGNGIKVQLTAAGTASVTLDQVQLNANEEGLRLDATASGAVVQAAIRNSSASGNITGVFVGQFLGNGSMDIESSLIANNGTGITTQLGGGGSAQASISNCTITNNSSHGFDTSLGGTILTRGNNTIARNGTSIGSLLILNAQ